MPELHGALRFYERPPELELDAFLYADPEVDPTLEVACQVDNMLLNTLYQELFNAMAAGAVAGSFLVQSISIGTGVSPGFAANDVSLLAPYRTLAILSLTQTSIGNPVSPALRATSFLPANDSTTAVNFTEAGLNFRNAAGAVALGSHASFLYTHPGSATSPTDVRLDYVLSRASSVVTGSGQAARFPTYRTT